MGECVCCGRTCVRGYVCVYYIVFVDTNSRRTCMCVCVCVNGSLSVRPACLSTNCNFLLPRLQSKDSCSFVYFIWYDSGRNGTYAFAYLFCCFELRTVDQSSTLSTSMYSEGSGSAWSAATRLGALEKPKGTSVSEMDSSSFRNNERVLSAFLVLGGDHFQTRVQTKATTPRLSWGRGLCSSENLTSLIAWEFSKIRGTVF